MKKVNAAYRKYVKNPASLDKSKLTDSEKEIVKNHKPTDYFNKEPYFQTSGTATKIRNTKKRLESMVANAGDETKTLYKKGDIKIVDNVESNRIQVDFPGKPSEEIRKVLKTNGFRWAPSEGVWQRKRSANANFTVRRYLIKELDALNKSFIIPSILLFGVN